MASREFFIAYGDLHSQEYCPQTLAAIKRAIKIVKPKWIIDGGDHFDLRAARNGASKDDKLASTREDVDFGLGLLDDIQPNVVLDGNHDYRLYKMALSDNTFERDLGRELVKKYESHLRQLRAKHIPWSAKHGKLQLGKYKIMHGYKTGQNAAREMGRIYGNVIFFHTHAKLSASIERDEACEALCPGCVTNLEPEWSRGQTNVLTHRKGFAVGFINPKTGNGDVHAVCEVDGQFQLPKWL